MLSSCVLWCAASTWRTKFSMRKIVGLVITVSVAVAAWYVSSHQAMAPPPPPGPTGLYPGDEVIPDAVMIYDQTKLIQAPPSEVWPWVQQVGKGRGGTLHERLHALRLIGGAHASSQVGTPRRPGKRFFLPACMQVVLSIPNGRT